MAARKPHRCARGHGVKTALQILALAVGLVFGAFLMVWMAAY